MHFSTGYDSIKDVSHEKQRRGVIKVKSKTKIVTALGVGLVGALVCGVILQTSLVSKKTTSYDNKSSIALKTNNEIKEINTGKNKDKQEVKEEDVPSSQNKEEKVAEVAAVTEKVAPTPEPEPIVYDGMTMNQLAEKLNRSLGNDKLAGTGYAFASKSIAYGVDPYLAVAIVLHETGCKWNCSSLVRSCNNVGGMKGNPGCGGGSYASFTTLEIGIESYISNLYRNYYAVGLNTPESIGSKYAASTSWPSKINWYMNNLRAS